MRGLIRSVPLVIVLALSSGASAQVVPAPTGPERQLPSSVLAVFRKAFPDADITGAEQQRQDGKIVFSVECRDGSRHRKIVYALDGTVVENAEQVTEAELPDAVRAALHSYVRVYLVRGMKVTRGARVQYDLAVRGTRRTRMIVEPDGTVVSFR